MKKKKVSKIIAITLVLLICFFIGLYIIGIRSDAYNFAVNFIGSNETVTKNIGTVKNNRLAFWGYSIRCNGPHGYAEYKIYVTGEKGKGAVYLKMEKDTGIWKVIEGNLVLESGVSFSLPEKI